MELSLQLQSTKEQLWRFSDSYSTGWNTLCTPKREMIYRIITCEMRRLAVRFWWGKRWIKVYTFAGVLLCGVRQWWRLLSDSPATFSTMRPPLAQMKHAVAARKWAVIERSCRVGISLDIRQLYATKGHRSTSESLVKRLAERRCRKAKLEATQPSLRESVGSKSKQTAQCEKRKLV